MLITALLAAVLACLVFPAPDRGPGAAPGRADPGRPGRSWVARVVARARLPSRRPLDGAWVADFAEVVAVGLDAGLDLPSAALASAGSPGVAARAPWLADRLRGAVGEGRGVAALLEPGAGTVPPLRPDERRDLDLLVAAWRLAEGVGAAASTVTAAAAASVRERQAAADRAGAVVAGPRASMALLSALPLAGPAAALLVGMPPVRLYDTTAARLLAAAGLLLTGVGWWWARWLLRRAGRPGRTDGGAA